MGARPVSRNPDRPQSPNWSLGAPHDESTQGLVVSGFSKLPCAQALFLRCPDDAPPPRNRSDWLRALRQVAPISDADGRDERSAAIAFTWTGLKALGLDERTLASFSAPFREGMYQEDRLRRLGDRVDGTWQKTVRGGGPCWSGNTDVPPAALRATQDPSAIVAARPEEVVAAPVRTAFTVHALLLLYDETETAAAAWAEDVKRALQPFGLAIRRLALDLHLDEQGLGREHFGFIDGISQPIPFEDVSTGIGRADAVLRDGQPASRDNWHGVPLGEILFGHVNGHHELAPGPILPDDPEWRDRAVRAGLQTDRVPAGFFDFGRDGSYLVVRQLRQDVAAFWRSMQDGADQINADRLKPDQVTKEWLAERVVGRSVDGHLLCPAGYLKADASGRPENAFGFFQHDRHAGGCPPGSHVRRGNPRDGLAPDPASRETMLAAANNHRILRRGRKYGPKPQVDDPDDSGKDRGLLFMCLNTDIARQFEFVQQNWILNANFATLYDETDPLIGPKGPFTIREPPFRRVMTVETFVQLVGGEYFFLPSLPALRFLAGEARDG